MSERVSGAAEAGIDMTMAETRLRALAAVEAGRSQAVVARELGLSPSTVSRWAKEYRLQEDSGGSRRDLLRGEYGAIGQSRSALFGALGNEEYLAELQWPQNITVYDKMRRSDSQVQAMLLVLELPLRSTRWWVEPYSDSAQDKQIAEAVEENLMAGPPVGLTQHWDDFLRLALMMFPFGHSVFEKVFEVAGGLIKWRKFAPRPQRTIYDFQYDENGGPAGVKHLKVASSSYEYVEIPIDKLLIFSHRMEGGDLRGNSILRASYKHWKIKDFLYKIVNIGVERNLVGVPTLKHPSGIGEADKALAKEIVETLRSAESAGVRYPDGWELGIWEGKRGMMEVLPYIQHQDLMMVRGILAQFINLGSSDVGSFALSKDQSDLFLMTLNASGRYVANVINSHAIPQLVNWNWRVEGYPKLKFRPLGESTQLLKVLQDMVGGKLIVPDDNIETWLRDLLELPEKGEPLAMPAAAALKEPEPKVKPEHKGICGCEPLLLDERRRGRTFAGGGQRKWRRDLTTYEQRVNLAEIESKWDTEEEKFVQAGQEIVNKQIQDLFERVRRALEAGDYDELAKIPVRYRGEFTKFLGDQQRELIDFGVGQAAGELEMDAAKVTAPAEARKIAAARSAIVADQVAQKIKTRFTLTVLGALEGGAVLKAALFDARKEAEDVAKRELVATASVQIGEAINQGRQLALGRAGVQLAQYSAILDDVVCPLCEYLDGMIIEVDNPDYDRFTPRLHQSCRCLWVGIKPDEEPQPGVTWESPDPDMVAQYGSLVLSERPSRLIRLQAGHAGHGGAHEGHDGQSQTMAAAARAVGKGLAKEVDYSGIDPGVADRINEELTTLVDRHPEMRGKIGKLTTFEGTGQDGAAAFSGEHNTMRFNTYGFGRPDVDEMLQKNRTGLIYDPTLAGTVKHEFGHAAWSHMMTEEEQKPIRKQLMKLMATKKTEITQGLSKYALADVQGGELVAEMFNAKSNGATFTGQLAKIDTAMKPFWNKLGL